jgi:hypothetical protein
MESSEIAKGEQATLSGTDSPEGENLISNKIEKEHLTNTMFIFARFSLILKCLISLTSNKKYVM